MIKMVRLRIKGKGIAMLHTVGFVLAAIVPIIFSVVATAVVKSRVKEPAQMELVQFVVRPPYYAIPCTFILAALGGVALFGLIYIAPGMVKNSGWAAILLIILCSLLVLSLLLYGVYAAHSCMYTRLLVYPSHMVYYPEFRRPIEVQYRDLQADENYTGKIVFLRVYNKGKRLFSMDSPHVGYYQLIQTLRQNNVPFTIKRHPLA